MTLALCSLYMAFFSLGCQKTSEDVICDSIIERLEPYKTSNEAVIARLEKTATDEGLTELGFDGEEFAYAVLDGFDYAIEDVDVVDKAASAQVTIKSKSSSGLLEKLQEAQNSFDLLNEEDSLDEDEKIELIHEIILQAIRDTENEDETIVLNFTLDNTEWVCDNATEELGKLNSIIFAG